MARKTLQGYLTKQDIGSSKKLVLTDWKGNALHYVLHRVVATYTIPPEYDTTQAVILVKIGKPSGVARRGVATRSVTYAAGYALGEGMIFRGEIVGSAKWGTRDEAELVEEAESEAIALSEYWAERDEEHRQEEEEKMREEDEIYGRDPKRPRRRRRTARRTNTKRRRRT